MNKPAPYPADTRARGWRFEIDHERIFDQSETWALAPSELRPWLLMLWLVAWRQTPCGSLPDDDELIAAKIGMTPRMYAKHCSIIRRGWWLADDGRLYHDTIAGRVRAMLDKRAKDARRAANSRGRARESTDGHTDVTRDSTVSSTPSTKHQEKEKPPKPPAPPSASLHRFPPGFETLWTEYPRKVAKDAAAKAFAKLRPDAALLATMVAAVRLQRDSEQWLRDGGRFVPHLATWLNAGRWKDELQHAARVDDVFAGAV